MEQIELHLQERHTVTLPSLASAGYQWSAVTDNPKVVAVAPVIRDRISDSAQPSQSLDEQFDLIGTGLGKTTVHFSQARSFESGKNPRAVYNLPVQVVSSRAGR